MSDLYSTSSRDLQDRFDTRRLADRLAEVKVHDRFTPDDRAFIEGLDMFFLATVDAEGRPTCSYKGGDPGFVVVLFIDLERQRRMRVDGTAGLTDDHALVSRWPEAQFGVRVTADRIYPNCPRYIHRYARVERSPFVPRNAQNTPVPAWKQADWAVDVLPAGDPARGA